MRLIGSLIVIAVAVGWFWGSGSAGRMGQLIPDVSWPNCSLGSAPEGQAGIVGINGGLALRPNPCLAQEAGWFKYPSVYLNTGYPGIPRALKYQNYPKQCVASDEICVAYNYGYNSGRYAVGYALTQGVIADRWWLDVETENSWSDNVKVNQAALTGMLDMVSRFAGKDRVGFYSYPGQWNLLTGEWKNGYPTWVATGSTDIADAIAACSKPSFTGGEILLSQFVPSLDQNYPCR